MRKEIIAVQVPITRQGAQVYFAVRLPKDTLYTERIETGLSGVAIVKGIIGSLAGTLQLQGMEKPNVCYITDVLFGSSPLDNVLLGFNDNEVNNPLISYALLPFVAAQKREPERVRFAGSYMLYGYYRDEVGLGSGVDIVYTVGLYLHIVINN